MARPTMATLITRLRKAVGDPAGGSQAFTDDELQDALDAHRVEVRLAELLPVRSVASGGAVSYLEYLAPRGYWEDAPVLQGSSYATLAVASSDLLVGRWTFAASQTPPVYITGQVYDLYGAAVEILEAWIGKAKLEFDFATDAQRFDRSQKVSGIEKLIATYRRRARPPAVRLVEHRWAW